MEIFRISKKAFAQIDGLGGLYYPGRWHNAGHKVVYAAEHRSLAVLETLVHLSKTHLLMSGFVITSIDVPRNIKISTLSSENLSSNWTVIQKINETRRLGTQFLENMDAAILKVPSAIIENEFNYLLNPNHPDFKYISIKEQLDFSFDVRLVEK